MRGPKSSSGTMGAVFGSGNGYGAGSGNGVYRASDASLKATSPPTPSTTSSSTPSTQPVTIHKNESAMVPILQQELPAEHVTLWSRNHPRPLRAVWLENKSKLTLDSGSFSIFESGEFAGEGLLDPIHPGERRLLSMRPIRPPESKFPTSREDARSITCRSARASLWSITRTSHRRPTLPHNSGDEERIVLLEHPRHTNGWTLDEGVKADDTTPDLYRFRIPCQAAHRPRS